MTEGIIELDVNTKSLGVRGETLFKMAMENFGQRASGVKGMWFYGDNLATLNTLTARGVAFEDAAWGTWTGKMAKEAGFKKMRIMGTPQKVNGKYVDVEVVFER